MNPANLGLAEGLVSTSYIRQGGQGLAARQNLIKTLLSQRRLPERGWDENTIELFLQDCALMDSNNFVDNVGVGEREARVACPLVYRRNFGLAHGAGRSGDLAAEQPKAAGSSLLLKVTELLTHNALKLAGLGDLGACAVLPLATGMAITMVLLSLKAKRPATAKHVVWSRIDQKTCVKAIVGAGLSLVVVPLKMGAGGQLGTDVEGIQAAVDRLGADNVCCVVTTTSCFAPRASDDVIAVAKLCEKSGVGHVVNNAYGVQSAAICKQVAGAWRRGRVDAVVQSTDKNFMVPVGGAIVCAGSKDPSLVAAVTAAYPGRASSAPALDLLITLLHWGVEGWARVLREREELYKYMKGRIGEFAREVGEEVVESPGNPISVAMTLDTVQEALGSNVTFLGSMLFSKCVSGTRVVPRGKEQVVAGHSFRGYGSHADDYPHAYLTAAAAVGGSREEVEEFIKRLRGAFKQIQKKHAKGRGAGAEDSAASGGGEAGSGGGAGGGGAAGSGGAARP